jgi:non-ribosomal peptide synthetase component E (peptide arylation enzyme)
MPTNRPDFTTWVDDVARAEFEGRGHWTSQTWMDVFLASVKQQPSALCVADEQAALTRAQVLACARRLARRMASRGVGAGDVVRVAVPNWREFVVIHAAIVGYPDIASASDARSCASGGWRSSSFPNGCAFSTRFR